MKVEQPDAQSIRKGWRTFLSDTLWFLAFTLSASTLSVLIFSRLPPRLFDPIWQLSTISSILTATTPLLLAVALTVIAAAIDEKSTKIRERFKLMRKLSAWFSLVLLLLIPLQIHAGSRVLKLQSQPVEAILDQLKSAMISIRQTQTEPDFRSAIRRLPNAPEMPAQFDSPFPVIKQRVITNLQGKINSAKTELERLDRESIQRFMVDSSRNGIQALLMSMAFLFTSRSSQDSSSSGVMAFILRRLKRI